MSQPLTREEVAAFAELAVKARMGDWTQESWCKRHEPLLVALRETDIAERLCAEWEWKSERLNDLGTVVVSLQTNNQRLVADIVAFVEEQANKPSLLPDEQLIWRDVAKAIERRFGGKGQ